VPVESASVPARTRLDFWFDAAILVGYTVAYSYGFTGVVIHEAKRRRALRGASHREG
jgi:hypothetical protein